MKRGRRAPGVTEHQAKVLRLARDGGSVRREGLAQPQILDSCYRRRWLAPREEGYVLTDGGKAALEHYQTDEVMEQLWERTGGDVVHRRPLR